jgi:hypothetical protein
MATPFIFPTIASLPAGYDCVVAVPTVRLAQKCVRSGLIRGTIRAFYEGEVVDTFEHLFEVRDRKPVNDFPQFRWNDRGDAWGGGAGFLELSFRSEDGEAIFRDTSVVNFYTIYTKKGKKSFFSDNAYRYGSPPTIDQIAAFGKYIDAYPVIHLDRKRDLGETATLINPYKKAVRAKIVTDDGRELRGKINPDSALNIRLSDLLKDGEDEWLGHIQLTATNRLVTFHVKHSLSQPTLISDHEHMDLFRGEATHFPLTQMIRLRWGLYLQKHGYIE